MAESINCTRCHAALQLPRVVIGQEGRCSACQTAFTSQLPEPLPLQSQADETPREPPQSSDQFTPPGGVGVKPMHLSCFVAEDEDYPRRSVPALSASEPMHTDRYGDRSGEIWMRGLICLSYLGLALVAFLGLLAGKHDFVMGVLIVLMPFTFVSLVCGLIGARLGWDYFAEINRGERVPIGKSKALAGAICCTITAVLALPLFVASCVLFVLISFMAR